MSHDWKQLDETHGPMVWRVIYKILQSHSESLDCYQIVMMEAFDRSKTHAIQNWPGFLKWLAVRRGIDKLRERQRRLDRIEVSENVELVASSQRSISTSLEMQELKARIRRELTLLPESQAEAFWLRFIEQLTYSEIAEQMNIKSPAVGVLIHRARIHVCAAIADLRQPIGDRNEQPTN